MVKLTKDWILLEDGDRAALSMLLHLDFERVVMVRRKRLVCWLATAERISSYSSQPVAIQLERLVNEADKVGISGF